MQEKLSNSRTVARLKHGTSVLTQLSVRLVEDDCFGQAKGAAYSFILFFFPLLLFLVTLLVATDVLTALTSQLLGLVPDVLPPSSRDLITNYISAMVKSNRTDLLVGTFLIMVWIGSGMMITFMEGLDRAYRVTNPRSLVKARLVAISLVFLVGIPLVLLAVLTIFGSHLERLVVARLDLTLPGFWQLARWGFVLAATMVMITIIYYVGPHRPQSLRRVLPGSALATSLWMLSTLAFSAYVNRFGRYNVIYGSLGAGIVLLIWMYLSSLVVLIGGEFNALLEAVAHADRAGSCDRTEGDAAADEGDISADPVL